MREIRPSVSFSHCSPEPLIPLHHGPLHLFCLAPLCRSAAKLEKSVEAHVEKVFKEFDKDKVRACVPADADANLSRYCVLPLFARGCFRRFPVCFAHDISAYITGFFPTTRVASWMQRRRRSSFLPRSRPSASLVWARHSFFYTFVLNFFSTRILSVYFCYLTLPRCFGSGRVGFVLFFLPHTSVRSFVCCLGGCVPCRACARVCAVPQMTVELTKNMMKSALDEAEAKGCGAQVRSKVEEILQAQERKIQESLDELITDYKTIAEVGTHGMHTRMRRHRAGMWADAGRQACGQRAVGRR